MPAQTAAFLDDRGRIRQNAWVCQQNIQHFRRLMRLATDPAQRSLIGELVSGEKRRLEELEALDAELLSRPKAAG